MDIRHARTSVAVMMVALAVIAGTPHADAANARAPSLKEHRFSHDGMKRRYLLYTPRRAGKLRGVRPLVIVIHGGGGTHRSMVRLTEKRWNALADQHGFYIAYPNATEKIWDFGEGLTSKKRRSRVDDLGYFRRVIDDVTDRAPIGASRIFASGISRGGQASYFLACKLSEKIRAIAPVAMSVPEFMEDDCVTGPPVGVAIINGTKDPQVPYNGGHITVLGTQRDVVLSTDQSVRLWRTRNGCADAATDTTVIDKPGDKTSVSKSEWTGCSGAPVTLYRVENGGHTWPSGMQYLSVRLVGEVSHDIDGADEAWKFFSQFATEVESGDPSAGDGAGQLREGIAVPGYPKRPYDLFIPNKLEAPAPTLLVLHGGGADAFNAIRTTCPNGKVTHRDCITNHAARNGYIAVFPRGTSRVLMKKMRSWNGGGGDKRKQWICASGPACEKNVDDVRYFTALFKALDSRTKIDRHRVYAVGVSNGAAMAHRLACEMPERIAAIAAIAGTNQVSAVQGCKPKRPVPVLQIHGTADCAWPYNGGGPTCAGAENLYEGEFVAVDRSMRVWRDINGCADEPTATDLPDQFDDDTQVTRLTWSGCKAALVEYRINGGGHSWPNGYQYLSPRKIGPVTREVTNDHIWTFLSSKELP